MKFRVYEGYGRMDVEVRSGATLAGGSIDGAAGLLPGKLTVKANGILDPGNSPYGILSVVGDHPDTLLEADSIYSPDLGGTVPGQLHGQLKLLGSLTLGDSGGLPILSPDLDYAPQIGDLMFIVRNDSTSAITGFFESMSGVLLGQGSLFGSTSSATGQPYTFKISYHGDTTSGLFETAFGNDIALQVVAIPEPISAVPIVIAIAGTVCGRRQRNGPVGRRRC